MSTEPIADPLVGKTVAQYTILAKLGGGGMGVVYQARDAKLGRLVALKFLPAQWSHDENAKQRFIREAQAASATDHPNICTVHAIESTDDGQLFIVMAHYDGQTLKQELETGPLGADKALQIATQVAEGLAKAHAQGVVHRDIKPGNLMITEDGVKILDFGLAKFADSLHLTIAGSTFGTMAYMSPEQARGEEADARSDIWAVGVVLYEMLTGERPFKGIYPEAISYAIRNDPTPPLKAEARGISPQVERLVLRALQKDPADRYQNARELARDLRLVQGLPLPVDLRTEALPAVPSAGVPERLPWWRRVWNELKPARAIAVAGVFLLTVGVEAYRWITRPAVRVLVAIAPVANRTGEPELDDYRLALTEALVAELSDSPNLRVVPYLRLVELVRPFVAAGDASGSEAIQAIATHSGARFIVTPTLLSRSGAWWAQIDIKNAETGTSVARYETPPVTSSLSRDTAYALIGDVVDSVQEHFKANGPGRAYESRALGRRFQNLEAARAFEQGLNAYEAQEYGEALTAFFRAVSEDGQHAMTYAWLSRVLLIIERGSEAVEAAERATQLVTKDTPRADALFIEAIVADSRRDFAVAEDRYRQFERARSDDAGAYAELADFFRRRELSVQAVDAYHEVLRRDAGYLRPRLDLCQLYTQLDDHPRAEQQARTALDGYRAAGNRPGEAQALLCLGESQRKQGGTRLPEARRNVEGARKILESLNQPYNLARAIESQTLVEYTDGRLEQATRLFGEALSQSRAAGNRRIEGLALMNLGVAYQELGQPAKAIEYYRESHDMFEQSGNERLAAELDVEMANLLVNFGGGSSEALRRLANARATMEKLGRFDYEVDAMRVEAASERYAGRLAQSRRLLLAALSVAKEKQLGRQIASLAVDIGRTDLLLGEYESARKLLDDLVTRDPDRKNVEARIALGRVLVRLGDFDSARRHLNAALADVEARRLPQFGQFAPLAHAALGELAYEAGRLPEARGHFGKAAAFWTDALPDAASVEARCYLGLLDAFARSDASAKKHVEAGLEQARKMGHLNVEARCGLHLARIDLAERRYADAAAALSGLPLDGERTIGPELRAQVHYWRGRAMSQRGDRAGAEAEAGQALALAKKLQAALPAPYAERFASRADIRQMIEQPAVRERP